MASHRNRKPPRRSGTKNEASPQPLQPVEMEPFWKLPEVIANRKDIKSAAKVLWARLMDLAKGSGRVSWGVRKLAGATGLAVETVQEHLEFLEAAGLLRIVPQGRGKRGEYLLPSVRETSTVPSPRQCAGKPDTTVRETSTQVCGKPVHVSEQTITRAAEAAPAAAVERPEASESGNPVKAALVAAAIGGKARNELVAAFSGIPNAPDIIRSTVESMSGRGKGSGAIIAQLRAAAEAERLKASRRSNGRPRVLPRPIIADETPRGAEVDAIEGVISGMTPVQRAHYKELAVAGAAKEQGTFWRLQDETSPKNMRLRREMARLYRVDQGGQR